MPEYRAQTYIPPLVKRAMNLAEQMDYHDSCSEPVGRLIQLLASQLSSGVIGEVGAGCGVATAWIASTLSPGTSFFALEEDVSRAAAARALFDPLLNVRVIQGDWKEFLRNWRFAMLFASRTSARESEPELLLRALRPGGLMVLDGLTPVDRLPLESRHLPHPLRDFWLNDARLIATEFLVANDEAVILATRTE